jgi:hypothetical protein
MKGEPAFYKSFNNIAMSIFSSPMQTCSTLGINWIVIDCQTVEDIQNFVVSTGTSEMNWKPLLAVDASLQINTVFYDE